MPEALRQAEECFLTNTTMELMPVRDVDQHLVGTGKPGPLTLALHEQFRASLDRFLS
jgi:branched-chain amino acid aminotransferase